MQEQVALLGQLADLLEVLRASGEDLGLHEPVRDHAEVRHVLADPDRVPGNVGDLDRPGQRHDDQMEVVRPDRAQRRGDQPAISPVRVLPPHERTDPPVTEAFTQLPLKDAHRQLVAESVQVGTAQQAE